MRTLFLIKKKGKYQDIKCDQKVAGVFALIVEYLCFSYKNQDINWYEDQAFYLATMVKFMRLGSLVASKYYADKITEYFTGNRLTIFSGFLLQ